EDVEEAFGLDPHRNPEKLRIEASEVALDRRHRQRSASLRKSARSSSSVMSRSGSKVTLPNGLSIAMRPGALRLKARRSAGTIGPAKKRAETMLMTSLTAPRSSRKSVGS